MNLASDAISFAFIAQTTMLVITSLLTIYPVVAYAHNVAHTRGLVLLAGAFFVVTAAYVASFLLGMTLLAGGLDLVAASLAAAGLWQFARPFVRIGEYQVETPTVNEASGGFESAGED